MNSDITTGDPNPLDNQLSLDESRELLSEIRHATKGTSQHELSTFTTLVCQVLDLHEQTAIDGHFDSEAMSFITSSIDEIRSLMNADASTSDQLDSLRAEALRRWGDGLATDDEFDCEPTLYDEEWESGNCDMADCDADIVAPSATEITALLSQLGKAPENPPAPTAPAPIASTPTVRTTTAQKAIPVAEPIRQSTSSTITIASLDVELREAFLDDAASCVSSMEAAVLRLESNPTHVESLTQICRELHTLKGASASVGLVDLANQLHILEDRLGADEGLNRETDIDLLLKSVDSIRGQIFPDNDVSQPATQPIALQESLCNQAPEACQPKRRPAPALASFDEGPADDESVRVKSSQLNRLMDMLAELVMLRNRRETELSELQEVYHELIGSVSKMRMLSLDADDHTIHSSSLQLSEIANDVLEVAQNVRDCARPVAEGNTAVSQFIRDFRRELVELRRTPVAGLFRRLQRVVRDAAQAESKDVQLQLLGEDAGIERSLQQRLYEPLLHIVRNCVCHGIETADERLRLGKNPSGTITLEANSGPDLFVIEIRDDGRGLDYDAIRRRGIESGLLAVNQSVSRHELSQLIFQPGFSTRQSANQVAGRGVGMDVVASTLQRMQGWLEIDSQPQQGTRIRLSFPLPSVIQHAMLFRASDQLFALPMQSVQSAGEVAPDAVCVEFSDLLDIRDQQVSGPRKGVVLACEAANSRESGNRLTRVTLLVDEIVGPEEVVVRPLPAILKHHPFCSGATLSGMGQTVLFLDAHRVLESQSRTPLTSKRVIPSDRMSLPSSQSISVEATRPHVLVVDDSITARKRVVRSLGRYPIDITEASNGREALQVLKTERFAAVFSDMEMPHISGLELLAAINSRYGDDAPPVVIISSRGEDEFTIQAKRLGANNYLIKPLTDEALDGVLTGIALLRHVLPSKQNTFQTSGDLR